MHDAPAQIRRVVLVSGLVQGVYFRDSCRAEAVRLGVSGSVENLPDGRVRGDFEGPASAVDALVAWCRRGPARARVEAVAVHEEVPLGTAFFQILR